MKKNNFGFTLIEILLGILIFSIVIIAGFQALSSITLGRIKLIEKTDITKEAFYFSEKLFEEIKNGGTIDFEEYFNRKVINLSAGANVGSGHYRKNTGFGNFGNGGSNPGTASATNYGSGFYFCRSRDGSSMGTGGCYNQANFNHLGVSGGPQRYGQYIFQFFDYNTNKNNDGGDENNDGNIRGDDDDENIGEGPTVFTGGENVREIYLISGDRKKRTLLRWNYSKDPDPKNVNNNDCTGFYTGSCLGKIEILKLEGKDWGLNHNSGSTSTGSFDGIIDTWIIDKEFSGGAEVIAGSNNQNYRVSLFPSTITVSSFEVFMYPDIDKRYAWKHDASTHVSPYLRIQLTLEPSRKKKSGMKGEIPKLELSTTIHLTDYFSK